MKLAKDLLKRSDWIILDTETTGLDDEAQAVQIGILSPSGDVLLDTLIKPTCPIPWDVSRLHGITDEMVKDAPGFISIEPKIQDITAGKTIVVYNASFDRRILQQTAKANGVKLGSMPAWVCVMEAYAQFWGVVKHNAYGRNRYQWQSLGKACQQQGIEVKDAHTAIGDCQMTLALIRKLGQQ